MKTISAAIWLCLTGYFISTGGYETAGYRTWTLYLLLSLIAVIGFIRIQKGKLKWSLVLLFFLVLVATPCFFAMWYHGQCSQTLRLGKVIQTNCERDGHCPIEMPGWERRTQQHYAKGKLHYNPGNYTSDYTVFRLYCHFAGDWNYWVYGGVGKPLRIEVTYL